MCLLRAFFLNQCVDLARVEGYLQLLGGHWCGSATGWCPPGGTAQPNGHTVARTRCGCQCLAGEERYKPAVLPAAHRAGKRTTIHIDDHARSRRNLRLFSYANFRYFAEMLSSGYFSDDIAHAISDFRESHTGTLSGMTRFLDHLDDMP